MTNLVLAVIIAGALFLLSPLLAAGFLVVGVLFIAFVGYLFPGTPYLTQRFFPKRVLGWFGKAPPETPGMETEPIEESGELEADVDRLVTVGALSEDDDGLTLAPAFEQRWLSRIENLRDDETAQREAFAPIIDADSETIRFEPIPETGAFAVRVGDGGVSQWMSQAAFVADVAANDALGAIDPAWGTIPLQERHQLLMGLRQFLDSCPLCGGRFVEENEATESCCRTISSITVRCADCESRLYVQA